MTTLVIMVGKYLVYGIIILAGAIFLILPPPERKKTLIFGLIVLPASYIIALIAGKLFYDPRPFVAGHFVPLIAHNISNGFPSDHALLGTALAAAILSVRRGWGITLYILALAVGYARVAAGIHHSVDIIGSVAITAAVAVISYAILFRPRNLN